MKKISVITINLNNVSGLQKTIDSVIDQNYDAVECIVIDGGSTDGSAEWIRQNSGKIQAWVSEKDNGIYNAQNKGALKATGDYCLFLNSGDVLANNSVLKEISVALGTADIVYGDIITLDKKGGKTNLYSPEILDVAHFMVSTLWHPSAFIKRSVFEKHGLYNEALKIAGDYEFFIRTILKHNVSTKHIALPVSIFNLEGLSNSESMHQQQIAERKKSWELNFSQVIIHTFEEHTRLLRSREYRLGRLVKKILRPFSA